VVSRTRARDGIRRLRNAVVVVLTVTGAIGGVPAPARAVTGADVQACANAAVADVENLPFMSTTFLEGYAAAATLCVATSAQYASAFSVPSEINEVAFAMNTVARWPWWRAAVSG
jgi:hypothetical protein